MDSLKIGDRLRALAAAHVGRVVAEGVAVYCRASMLSRLLPLAPVELVSGVDPAGAQARTRSICLMLARALRRERTRGRAGHWTYDVERHLALLQAYRAERAELLRLSRPGDVVPPDAPEATGQGRCRRSRARDAGPG